MADQTGRKVFKELGISKAAEWSLSGEELEQQTELQGMSGIQTWDNIRKDHTGAAIIAGLTLPIYRSSWDVEPASNKAIDQQPAEFLHQCMHDMSHSWTAMIVDAATLFPFGWAWLEQIMKPRLGLKSGGRDAARSKYNDGRIGWRKIVLRPQTTIVSWKIDEHGGIQAVDQSIPKKPQPVTIPIQRSLLFRTTTEGNKPEGESVFRAAWRPWRQRRRLEIVEGMGLTRNLAGLLQVTLGPNATTRDEAGNQSDEAKAEKLIQDAFEDRVMGFIQSKDLAVGLMDGPRGTNYTALGRAIIRKDTEMARASLAHFITLALQERGSYALAKDESDLFLMAVMAYLDSMVEVIQRFAVERLFRLNVFPGITELPQLYATAVYKPDIGELADAINNLAGATVLTPDDTLEAYIRELAGFPELPADLTREARAEQLEEREEPEEPKTEVEQPESEEEGIEEEEAEEHAEYSRRRSKKARSYLDATQQYEAGLVGIYDDWVADAAQGLGSLGPDVDEATFAEKWDDYLGVALLLLKEKGYEDLLAAYVLGFGSPSIGPEGLKLVEEAQQKNDSYLAGSLFEDIRGKLEGEIAAILLLLKQGRPDEAIRLIENALLTLEYRLPLYAGTFWEMIHAGIGQRITERGTTDGPPVRRVLDPLAKHCSTCPGKAKVYASWSAMVAEAGIPGDGSDECDGRCRCSVQELHEGVWIWA